MQCRVIIIFRALHHLIQRLQLAHVRRVLAINQHAFAGLQFRLGHHVIVAAVKIDSLRLDAYGVRQSDESARHFAAISFAGTQRVRRRCPQERAIVVRGALK
ncbi:MAG: hypothetical protein JMDDDDMK_01289 [Acidobacteria bacterium]|nr:hypothetical protein [Acidobacteriota bacterium]